MNPRMALLFVCAVLLVVANMVGEGSDVARIAERGKKPTLAQAQSEAGNPDGFADDSEVGPQPEPEELDEEFQQSLRLTAQEQPAIGEFSLAQAQLPRTVSAGGVELAVGPLSEVPGMPLHDRSGMKPGEVRTDFNPRLR